jgi:transcriptional regulator with XRE-family HTH domain
VYVDGIYASFGVLLKEARKRRGLSQEALARRIDLGRTSVVNLEAGHQRVQLHTLILLARALDLPVIDLIPPDPRDERGLAQPQGLTPQEVAALNTVMAAQREPRDPQGAK